MSLAPDTRAEIDADLKEALAALLEHVDEYADRSSYFHGKIDEVLMHKELAKVTDAYRDRFRFNYAGIPARTIADRLDLQALRSGSDSVNEKLNTQLWDHNDLDDDADDYHLRACYLGDYYVITWPGTEEVGSATPIQLTGRDPSTTRILYEPGNPRRPKVAIARWEIAKSANGTRRWRLDLYYDDQRHRFQAEGDGSRAEAYTYLEVELEDENGDGKLTTVPDIEAHDWGFPVHHFRPDAKPYGVPVNAAAYGPQDAITKVLTSMLSTVDALAAPGRVALLDGSRETGDDIDADFGVRDEDDDEKATTKQGGPGTTEYMDGVKELVQLTPAGSAGFLDPLEFAIKQIPVLTRTPLREYIPSPGGAQESGTARQREDAPMVKHARKLAGGFGSTWKGIGDFALRVWGENPDTVGVEPVWVPMEMSTDAEGMALVKDKIATGMPPRDAYAEAGYPTEQLDVWFPPAADGDDEGMTAHMTPALLKDLSGVLQQLGSAKTTGSITDRQIAALLARYLGPREVGEQDIERGYTSRPLEPVAAEDPAEPDAGAAAAE